jgi:hypothetical protein
VFASATGTPLNYHNVYSRVLRPALERSGLALVVGETVMRKRDGTEERHPVYDYQGIAFHPSARRAARCCSRMASRSSRCRAGCDLRS